ncbi:SpoIIE family protein phosphatase [Blastococcus sp. SYSU DS0541]
MTGSLPSGAALPPRSDPAFERFARLVRRQLDVPVALVTLVSADEQVFPGAVGLPEPWQSTRRTPLSHSFCQHVVRSAAPLVIADARTDPLVAENLAIPDLRVIAYAGVPLTDGDGDGVVVGSLCAIDSRPRTWSDDDLAVLTDLAGACSSELWLRAAQQRADDAVAQAQESAVRAQRLLVQQAIDRSRWALALDAGKVGTFDLNLATGALTVDDRLLELSGMDRDTFTGRPEDVYVHVHPDDVADVRARVQHAVDTGGIYDAEYRIVLADGSHRWVAARGQVIDGADGATGHLVGVVHDTTDRALTQQQTQRAAARERLLSRITEELSGTLDADEAAHRLARLVLPAVADWCIVTLIDDDQAAGSRRGLRPAAAEHVDPAMRPVLDGYAQARLGALGDEAIVVRAMRTGQVQLVGADATAHALTMLTPGPTHEAIRALAPEAMTVLPLPGRTGPVGLMTLANGADRGPFTHEDLNTARHVAGRAGLVLDNARLFRQQRDLAEGFQRSLLTPPPEPDHLQIVVRYVPAAQAAQVGGDWYDAFMQPSGATLLVIGDVVGHDVQAAAAMGQIRSIVRTLGALDHDGPAAVLCRVEQVMETLQTPILATTVVARLEQTDEERADGLTRLRWSNAGHPPPMAVTIDGSVTALTTAHTDLLLGVDATATRRESQVHLGRDTVVLFYTDGLVERRDSDLDAGTARLQDTLAELAGRNLDELCDELLDRMLPDAPDDDVALVAVRLHPQDRPRPAEAGPERVPPNLPAD